MISWIGHKDLEAARTDRPDQKPGPVLRLLLHRPFDEAHLLNDMDRPPKDAAAPEEFREWVARQACLPADRLYLHSAKGNLRNQYRQTYEFTRDALKEIRSGLPDTDEVVLLLSPGTPAAQVAMLLGAQTVFDGKVPLYNTWDAKDGGTGVELVEFPFSLTVDLALPKLLQRWQREVASAPLPPAFETILGESAAMKLACQIAFRVARFPSMSVLIRGETGTGKELFARAIHEIGAGPRKPIVALNCAAMPAELLESELFGHVRGAFTGAEANYEGKVKAAEGGTLFLDEIGDMSPRLQAKLLRLLQERTYSPVGTNVLFKSDFRLVTATHRDLGRLIAEGQFRADLFYRIARFEITLPPLRERGKDIAILARAFLNKFNKECGTSCIFAEDALDALAHRSWRGNVRELENAVFRLAVVAGECISREDVDHWLDSSEQSQAMDLSSLSPAGFVTELAAVIDELLERFGARTTAVRGQRETRSDRRGDLSPDLRSCDALGGRELH